MGCVPWRRGGGCTSPHSNASLAPPPTPQTWRAAETLKHRTTTSLGRTQPRGTPPQNTTEVRDPGSNPPSPSPAGPPSCAFPPDAGTVPYPVRSTSAYQPAVYRSPSRAASPTTCIHTVCVMALPGAPVAAPPPPQCPPPPFFRVKGEGTGGDVVASGHLRVPPSGGCSVPFVTASSGWARLREHCRAPQHLSFTPDPMR